MNYQPRTTPIRGRVIDVYALRSVAVAVVAAIVVGCVGSGRSLRYAYVGETAGRTQIYAFRDATEDPDRMTVSNASDADPALAKNGRDVAFASNRDGDWNIYVFTDTR